TRQPRLTRLVTELATTAIGAAGRRTTPPSGGGPEAATSASTTVAPATCSRTACDSRRAGPATSGTKRTTAGADHVPSGPHVTVPWLGLGNGRLPASAGWRAA